MLIDKYVHGECFVPNDFVRKKLRKYNLSAIYYYCNYYVYYV